MNRDSVLTCGFHDIYAVPVEHPLKQFFQIACESRKTLTLIGGDAFRIGKGISHYKRLVDIDTTADFVIVFNAIGNHFRTGRFT